MSPSTSPRRRSCAGSPSTAVRAWRRCTARSRTRRRGRRRPTRSRTTSSPTAWNDRGIFTQRYGSDALDASLLLVPLLRFLPPDDERVRNTVLAIADELTENGLVLRYRVEETDDGLSGEEGTFTICSFWLVSALVEIGELTRAKHLCERLLNYSSPLKLYAEEIDHRTGRHLGNFPQAFTPPRAHQRGHARHPCRGGPRPRRRFHPRQHLTRLLGGRSCSLAAGAVRWAAGTVRWALGTAWWAVGAARWALPIARRPIDDVTVAIRARPTPVRSLPARRTGSRRSPRHPSAEESILAANAAVAVRIVRALLVARVVFDTVVIDADLVPPVPEIEAPDQHTELVEHLDLGLRPRQLVSMHDQTVQLSPVIRPPRRSDRRAPATAGCHGRGCGRACSPTTHACPSRWSGPCRRDVPAPTSPSASTQVERGADQARDGHAVDLDDVVGPS